MNQGFGQFHLKLLDESGEQGIAAIAAGTALSVILQTLLKVGAELSQSVLLAGLFGEVVIQVGKFSGFEILQFDLKTGFASARIFFGIVLRKITGHGFAVTNGHTHNAFNKAGDHAAILEVHIHRFGAAALNFAAVVAVGAFKTNDSDISFCSLAALDRDHGGELTA